MQNFELINSNLIKIIDDVEKSLPPENVICARDLLSHAEYGGALDLICAQVFEFEIPISTTFYELIEQSGKEMSLPEENWKFLKDLIK